MKHERTNYFLVGLFVLLMGALLLYTLYRLTGNYGRTVPYYVEYADITDIHVGTLVTYGGYQVGQVSDITPLRQSGRTVYRLTLSIKANWKVPVDSVARIVIPRLLAESSIDIVEGTSDSYLPAGGELRGRESITPANLLRELNESIKPLAANLNAVAATLAKTVPELTGNLDALIKKYSRSADRLNAFLSESNSRHLEHLFTNADTISENLKEMSKGFNTIDRQLSELLRNSNAVLAQNNPDIRRAVQNLRMALETVSQHIDAIMYNLESSSRNINEFSRQIRQNPAILLRARPAQDQAAGQP